MNAQEYLLVCAPLPLVAVQGEVAAALLQLVLVAEAVLHVQTFLRMLTAPYFILSDAHLLCPWPQQLI